MPDEEADQSLSGRLRIVGMNVSPSLRRPDLVLVGCQLGPSPEAERWWWLERWWWVEQIARYLGDRGFHMKGGSYSTSSLAFAVEGSRDEMEEVGRIMLAAVAAANDAYGPTYAGDQRRRDERVAAAERVRLRHLAVDESVLDRLLRECDE
jgi:hypothetical protein